MNIDFIHVFWGDLIKIKTGGIMVPSESKNTVRAG